MKVITNLKNLHYDGLAEVLQEVVERMGLEVVQTHYDNMIEVKPGLYAPAITYRFFLRKAEVSHE